MKIESVKEINNFGKTIIQGEISFGSNIQTTSLGSCLSLILFSEKKKIGGLSHIVGNNSGLGLYNFTEEVIDRFQIFKKKYNIVDDSYFLIGGLTRQKRLVETAQEVLKQKNIKLSLVNILGNDYRKIVLIPKESKIQISVLKPNIFN